MKWAKRIAVIMAELALAIFITILLVSPVTIRTWVDAVNDLNLLIRLGAVIGINIGFFRLITMQIRKRKILNNDDLIVKISGVIADVSLDSVRERVTKAVQAIKDVDSVDTKVRAKDGKADIDLQVVMIGTINVPKKQKEVNQVIKKVVTEQLGLDLAGKPRVHIRLESNVRGKGEITEGAAEATLHHDLASHLNGNHVGNDSNFKQREISKSALGRSDAFELIEKPQPN